MEIARVRTVSTCITSILKFLISVEHKRVAFGHCLRIMMVFNLCVAFYVCCVWVFQRLSDARRGSVRRAARASGARIVDACIRADTCFRRGVSYGARRGERVRRGCKQGARGAE